MNAKEVNLEIAPRIGVDKKVRFGKPVISGTRVPVDLIIGKLGGGMTYEEITAEYEITREDILAALRYAANILSSEEVKAIS
ncbi:MAG: DUF433 domain-containing protein [Dehalococcoidia bacterium]|nr:MAG: DUF433 domain-containing protein [Dehalococcoidia bacterium]